MPGHMGAETTTVQNLEIVAVDLEENVILVKGNVPGPKQSLVIIKTSVKKGEKINPAEELITYVVETPVEETVEATEEAPVETEEKVAEE